MALEPITRQEKIIAGQDLTPITRLEMFLKQYGGGGGGGGGGATTLHINVTAVNMETMEVTTFTADKTPEEMKEAAATGPVWCVVTFAAGLMGEGAVSIGVPPAWYGPQPAFGGYTDFVHDENGKNKMTYAVRKVGSNEWLVDLTTFG